MDLLTGTGADVITTADSADQAITYVTDTTTQGADTFSNWNTGVDQVDLDISVYSLSGTAGDNLANGNYFEGAIGSATAGTAYDVMVLTGSAYADVGTAEDAVAGQMTSATDGFVIYFDTGQQARMFFDADLATDNNLTDAINCISRMLLHLVTWQQTSR